MQRTATSRTPAKPLSEKPAAPAIYLRSPFGRTARLIVVVSVMLIFLLAVVSVIAGMPTLSYIAIYSPEGLVDSTGAIFCLMASIVFFTAYQAQRQGTAEPVVPGRPARSFFYFLIALLTLVMFGEEIGWGSRMILWFSPAGGVYSELSLGSLIQPKGSKADVAMMYWAGVVITYMCALPIGARISSGLGRFLGQVRLPLPSFFLGMTGTLAVLTSMRLTFNPLLLSFSAHDVDEAFETALEFLMFAWGIEEYRWVRQANNRRWSRFASTALAVVAVVGATGIAFDFATRGYPASQSQRILQQAVTALREDGNEEEAVNRLEESIRLFPANDAAHFALGVLLDGQGRLAEALPHFQWAVKVAPNSLEYQQALAITYVNIWTGASLRASIPHFDAALNLMDEKDPRRLRLAELRANVDTFRRAGEHAAADPKLRARVESWREERRQRLQGSGPSRP